MIDLEVIAVVGALGIVQTAAVGVGGIAVVEVAAVAAVQHHFPSSLEKVK